LEWLVRRSRSNKRPALIEIKERLETRQADPERFQGVGGWSGTAADGSAGGWSAGGCSADGWSAGAAGSASGGGWLASVVAVQSTKSASSLLKAWSKASM
jgi:hypothetical protein